MVGFWVVIVYLIHPALGRQKVRADLNQRYTQFQLGNEHFEKHAMMFVQKYRKKVNVISQLVSSTQQLLFEHDSIISITETDENPSTRLPHTLKIIAPSCPYTTLIASGTDSVWVLAEAVLPCSPVPSSARRRTVITSAAPGPFLSLMVLIAFWEHHVL